MASSALQRMPLLQTERVSRKSASSVPTLSPLQCPPFCLINSAAATVYLSSGDSVKAFIVIVHFYRIYSIGRKGESATVGSHLPFSLSLSLFSLLFSHFSTLRLWLLPAMAARPKRRCVREKSEAKAHSRRMREIDGGRALKGQCNICLEVPLSLALSFS